ncbi:acylphosphatase [Vibrio sp. 10N.261.51.F12]|uniref:acylphosphatase n=1 Tax=Vibrio sp. 10N.261.51.F12 TaxID=3229679 RepID=UPI0035520835
MDVCKKFIIQGLVQGVGFRYHTCHEGLRLETKGYAKNLHDGSVEVVVCGTLRNVERLQAWLTTGPRTARVESVVEKPCDHQSYSGFKIL